MFIRLSVSVRMCLIMCTLPMLLKLSDNMGSSVSIVTRIRAELPDSIGSISGRRRSLNCTPECSHQLLGLPAAVRLVLCVFLQG